VEDKITAKVLRVVQGK